MSESERWRAMDRLFDAALDCPPEERTALLDAACAGNAADTELRQQVERLLAADAREAVFLDRPADEILGLTAGERGEPRRLGPYRLLRAIGRGGMGAVFLAVRDDEEYERLVAVKVLRSGLEDTELRHRFLAERQILARLEHPNIARLYDGGSTDDGRPYLVMELVEGVPVDEHCDRHRLTVDQRLALFLRICAAVQHAHQNLLVHRDIKPANILVTSQGEPKLLDFGIAKQLEPAADAATDALTRTGLRVMTPSYASPEQVKGEAITTASDVYSLGVLLYELLAGKSPHQVEEGAPAYAIERAIDEREPEKPSAALLRPGKPSPEEIAAARSTRPAALRRRLAGDLDTIVLTALRKEPSRRYESVARLASDLERHLRNLPVSARPDTLGYRTRKLVRRHRAAVTAAAAVVLLVAGLLVSLFVQGRQTAQERDKAHYALAFLVETFRQADPYQARGERLTAKELLARGTQRIASELAGQPDVQAAVMDAIGEADRGLGLYDAAEPLLERALAIRRRISGSRSLEVAQSLEHLASLRGDRSSFAEAESLLRQALAIRRRILGDEHLEVAKTLNALGDLLLTRGAPAAEIEAIQREALAIATAAEEPAGAAVAQSMLHLAKARQAAGDYAEAERLFRQGLAVERRALTAADPRLFRDETALGEILITMGKPDEAAAVLRRSWEAQRKALGEEHPDSAVTMGNLAFAVYEQGRFAEAEALNRRVLALVRSYYGPSHWLVPMVLGNLAVSLQSQQKTAEAVPYLEEALEARRRVLGEGHPLVAQALLLLAGAHRELGEYPAALGRAVEARAILEQAVGPDHPHLAYPAREIGRIYLAQKSFREAEPLLRRSLEIRRRELPGDHPEVARARVTLGECLAELGRDDEAAVLLRAAIATFTAGNGPKDPTSEQAQALLARIESRRGQFP